MQYEVTLYIDEQLKYIMVDSDKPLTEESVLVLAGIQLGRGVLYEELSNEVYVQDVEKL